MKWFNSLALVVVLVVVAVAGTAPQARIVHAQGAQTPDELCAAATQNIAEPATREFKEAAQVLKDGVDYSAVMCTEQGAIYLDLFEDKSPITVNSFVFLAQQGYYNNTTFHRVLAGFMAQGGDPTGTGSGGPGYEFVNETGNGLSFDTYGVLAMANAGADTNGSQFFITYAPQTRLDGGYTIFGHVLQGQGVAEMLTPRDPEQAPDFPGSTLQTVVIVEDPASVAMTPDAPPDMNHFETLLEKVIVPQINELFVKVDDISHTYDLDAEVAAWQALGGDTLAEAMRAYLSDHNFGGGALLFLKLGECPADAIEVWGLGFGVQDFGSTDNAKAVVFDDERAAQIEAAGAYEGHVDLTDVEGRAFSRAVPADQGCGPNGRYYHLELPYGRYIVVIDLILDGDTVSDTAEVTPAQYLAYVSQELVLGSLSGVLDRGNAAQ